MKISLTNQRKKTLWLSYQNLPINPKQTIRYIAPIIRYIKSNLPGVKYGGFHYKPLEKDKVNALKNSTDSIDAKILLFQIGMRDIVWSHENIMGSENDIDKKTPSRIIYFDAINNGWVGGLNL